MKSKILWKLCSVFILVASLSVVAFSYAQTSFLFLSLLTFAGLVAFLFARALRHNIQNILEASQKISKGDFSVKIHSGSHDELGHLSRTVNAMAEGLQKQRQELFNEKNQLKTVLDGMNEGVLVTNSRGEITLTNPALVRMMNIDESPYGKSVIECIRNQRIHDSVEHVLITAKPRKEEITVYMGAEERHLSITTAPLINDGDGPIGSVSVFHDVTDIRKLEDVRKEFVANVSHELKTPLTSIRGYAETLREGGIKDNEAAGRFLQKIEDNALHLQNLVEDILKLSQIESGRMEFRAEPMLLAPFLTDLCREFEERASKRRLSFSREISEALPKLSVDPKALRQIVGNLVDNAVQYTSEGGRVDVKAQLQGKEVVLSVTDTGIGISPEELSRIFERFYRADKARTRGSGTGLGLSIVKHLVQSQGWEIEAQSQVGKGSSFVVKIPTEMRLPVASRRK